LGRQGAKRIPALDPAENAARDFRRRPNPGNVQLRTQFGGAEYDRALQAGDSRRQAEAGLDKRTDRVESLNIRPLGPNDRARFVESWTRVQSRFVDGPGGAVTEADQLLVMNGDSYCAADLSSYIDWHVDGRNGVSLMLAKVSDTSRYGTVEVDAGGRITAFIEKRPEPIAGCINAGVYLFRRAMLEQFPNGPSSMERDVFPVWLRERAIMGWVTEAEFIDIGIPSDYERSHEFMARVSR